MSDLPILGLSFSEKKEDACGGISLTSFYASDMVPAAAYVPRWKTRSIAE
jgi:hypothetical protein